MAVTSMANSSIRDFQKYNAMGAVASPSATGGTTATYNGYRYHTFISSGTFTMVSNSASVDFVIIAGGGSGANTSRGGGGGGAGGVIIGSEVLTAGAYAVTVGAGGAGLANGVFGDGNPGGNSSIAGVGTAIGGGRGEATTSGVDLDGGSGGGGLGSTTGVSADGGAAVYNIAGYARGDIDAVAGGQGFNGGGGFSSNGTGGGGGGAGGPGMYGGDTWSVESSVDWGKAGQGGPGVRLDDWGNASGYGDDYAITGGGTAVYFAAGGQSAVENLTRATGPISTPGGGGGGGDATNAPTSAVDYTGSGGGGATDTDGSGSGGDGIVMIRYAI